LLGESAVLPSVDGDGVASCDTVRGPQLRHRRGVTSGHPGTRRGAAGEPVWGRRQPVPPADGGGDTGGPRRGGTVRHAVSGVPRCARTAQERTGVTQGFLAGGGRPARSPRAGAGGATGMGLPSGECPRRGPVETPGDPSGRPALRHARRVPRWGGTRGVSESRGG